MIQGTIEEVKRMNKRQVDSFIKLYFYLFLELMCNLLYFIKCFIILQAEKNKTEIISLCNLT